jgi:hypothetical protein
MQRARINNRQGGMWQMSSVVFNRKLDALRKAFGRSEVSSIIPYKDVDRGLYVRVIYSNSVDSVSFSIPNNLDLNQSDWEYLEAQIRENIPQHAD